MPTSARGFTLIEVLVALAIVALALMTGMRASGALTLNVQRQSATLLAQLCAENALNQIRLSQNMPGTGSTRTPCTQVARDFDVALTVRGTPNPSFVRIDAQVFEADTPILSVSTVQGRY